MNEKESSCFVIGMIVGVLLEGSLLLFNEYGKQRQCEIVSKQECVYVPSHYEVKKNE